MSVQSLFCRSLLWPLLVLFALAGCQEESGSASSPHTPATAPDSLAQIHAAGELIVLTRNTPSTYFQDRNDAAGFEFDLASAFARQLGVTLRIETADTIEQLHQRMLIDNRPLLVAAGLTGNPAREPDVLYSQSYLQVTPQVIYHVDATRPQQPADLVGKRILVLKDSVHAGLLQQLQEQHPELRFEVSDAVESIDLLRMVDEGQIDITLVNSNELAMHQVYFPHIQLAFSLQPVLDLQWMIRQPRNRADTSLLDAINRFLQSSKEQGLIDALVERYYGHLDVMGYVGANAFAKHLQQRMPHYEELFRKHAEEFGLDWQFLAAVGYQESHWDPDARSKTGVRGLMMLTQRTADEMGIQDRLDPEQSIRGGARYLAQMLERLPDSISYPERYWFALAAYNVGLGHLEDARRLTEQAGLDANRWIDVRSILPRLAQKQWYSQTRYGFARGGEPVHFVNNIRRYYDILSWSTRPASEDGIIGGLHTPAVKDR